MMRRSVSALFVAAGAAAAAGSIGASGGQQPPELGPLPVFHVSTKGIGHGLVTSMPPGIDCKPLCKAKFPRNARIILVATARAHSRFAGWGGACVGTSSWCVVEADANRSLSARFVRAPAGTFQEIANTYVERPILNVSTARDKQGRPKGTVVSSPGGITCPGMGCSKGFDKGKRVRLQAIPASGFDARRVHWTGPLVGCAPGEFCEVVMATTIEVMADFERK